MLAAAATRGRYCAFVTSCECEVSYLIRTEADGAHCKAAGPAAEIRSRYASLSEHYDVIEDANGLFELKWVEQC